MRREIRVEKHVDLCKESDILVLYQAMMKDETIQRVSLDGKERAKLSWLQNKEDSLEGSQAFLDVRQPDFQSSHPLMRMREAMGQCIPSLT